MHLPGQISTDTCVGWMLKLVVFHCLRNSYFLCRQRWSSSAVASLLCAVRLLLPHPCPQSMAVCTTLVAIGLVVCTAFSKGISTQVSPLFVFLTLVAGLHTIQVDYREEVNAMVGENVSLPCEIVNSSGTMVTMLEWKKQEVGQQAESRLLVHAPTAQTHMHRANISVKLKKRQEKLTGSILQLYNVSVWDSGNYICTLSTFPNGAIRSVTHLLVKDHVHPLDIKLYATVMNLDYGLKEGDQVTIFCNSTPPADTYTLSHSLKNTSVMWSQDGIFTLANVTRHHSGLYVCQPSSQSSGLLFKNHNITINLTVHFMDDLRCNSRAIQADTGQNATLSCVSDASSSLRYTWTKDNVTVSNFSLLQLSGVSENQAGIYTVTATMVAPPQLQKRAVVTVTVHSHVGPTWHEADKTYVTEDKSDPPQSSISSTMPGSTFTQWGMTPSPRTPQSAPENGTTTYFTGNSTTQPANETTPWSDLNATLTLGFGLLSTASPTLDGTATNLATSPKVNVTHLSGTSKRTGLATLFSFLVLAAVVTGLYTRYRIQRRLDLPPPFKPPPPPVKYTSVRDQMTLLTVSPMMDIRKI
uniref:Cell surface glycoprotein MUC18-like n=1 Tax=Paramormyrops kingsleyae TaxID=1676925 RepID=A0A3B3SSQ0_9TELE|nr:cell surface glycoprotein MUC18-like [Paramormyrops kingsleyae]